MADEEGACTDSVAILIPRSKLGNSSCGVFAPHVGRMNCKAGAKFQIKVCLVEERPRACAGTIN